MYWNYNNQSTPPIDTVFIKPDLNLGEILDHENILQELKSQNPKLIEFITRADILNELVNLVIEEPSSDLEEYERYRRPNLACEVLTTDIPRLNESLSDKSLLEKLFSFLEQNPPLNPLLASFVSRTLSILISRKVDQHWYSYQLTCLKMLEFLKSSENSSQLLLKHLGTSAIMDLTLKLLTEVEGDVMQQNLLNWLENVHLIENIVALFHPSVDAERQCNAAQLLCDTIRKIREKDLKDVGKPDPILASIQSPVVVRKLLGHMLDEDVSETSIAGGISVLLALLEPPPMDPNFRIYNNIENPGSGDPVMSSNPAVPTIVSVIVPYLPKLHNLLINPPKKSPIKLACGTIEPPLGNTRLTVIKLISALIATNTQEVSAMLDKLNTVQVLLDLFFHYTWNNFLHSQVDKCLAFALNSPIEASQENPLITNIFIKCRLLQRILEAWEDNETNQCKAGGKRRGYMGHLTNIANSVVKQADGNLGDFLNEHMDKNTMESWQHYVESILKPINEVHKRFLGGSHPAQNTEKDDQTEYNVFNNDNSVQQGGSHPAQNSEKDSQPEYNVFNNDNAIQEFPNCQNTSAFIENFDFEREDQAITQDESDKRAKQFKDLCVRKGFSDDLEPYIDKEEWHQLPSTWNNDDASSSDEDEKPNAEEIPDNLWESEVEAPVVKDPINPWLDTESLKDSPTNDGWANFSSADMENQFQALQMSQQETGKEETSLDENKGIMPEVVQKMQSESFVILPEEKDCQGALAAKSDNNANLNNFIFEEPISEEEFIDNFRFLTKQGMMSDISEAPNQSEAFVAVKPSDSVPQPAVSDESRKPKTPQDTV